MQQITVTTAFTLNLGDTKRSFEVGGHEVEDEIASHWYVRAHCAAEKPKKSKGGDGGQPGTDSGAQGGAGNDLPPTTGAKTTDKSQPKK